MSGAAAQLGTLKPGDLAELMAAFNDVAAKLQQSNEALKGEVTRLHAELRDANEQLQRSRRLAALGEMAAGIAHEVRNPLGSIRLYAEMLRDDLPDRPEQRATAEKIAGAVHGLDAIVTDVLTFSRELKCRPDAVDASALIDRAIVSARGAGLGVGVTVERLDDSRGVVLRCDPQLAQQAMANVVRNAFEAMRDASGDGHTLTTDVCGCEGGLVALRVSDTGDGIDPERIERIFNPFYTTRASGTGLGLPIVHRIAEAHGGRVEVRAREDRGTTVELFLPSWQEAAGETIVRRRMERVA